jgi:DNA-binding NarL/FixJ family response regulator
MPPRCLIVDDHTGFLEAARVLLERQGMTVAGVASTTADALRQAEALRPDIVLVDIMLGTESGFELARKLVDENERDATVILISTHAESDVVDLIAASSAAGFVPKSELSASAIERVLSERSD